ncbi:MAG: ribose 5-phosphate isomerase B [Oscillospiraceae bacterium]|nr:ribose 5-phosphate isomerase B [Oscillospiraceae bacterium]MBR5045980.1 ribose 5-phosphate isomerase B [Oscillospiraceae bacterium]MBR5070462.1 ribose 5-phosphate isomerase B [Oscillospiraceae bacterium]MBR5979580.1 ribose 5-phosphate isomerase B [Oscillospiraceae bacterium]
MKLMIGSDHGGFELKKAVKAHLEELGYEVVDVGCYEPASCDYPDIAREGCSRILSGECERGILICGTGIGISMAANKIRGIRAACCSDTYSAKYTRLHNDANVLCFGGRVVGDGLACEIVDAYLSVEFEGGRHQRRVDKIMALEAEER